MFKRAGQWWFKNVTGQIEYGPYDSKLEADTDRRLYMRFLCNSNAARAGL